MEYSKDEFIKWLSDEYNAEIEGYNETFDYIFEWLKTKEVKNNGVLPLVSNLRELLIDFMSKLTVNDHSKTIQQTVDIYLESINSC